MTRKCPKCEAEITSMEIKPVDAKIGNEVWPSITFNCPHCFMILGAQVDPIAIKIDTVREILEALRK